MEFDDLLEYRPRIEAVLKRSFERERKRAGPKFAEYVDVLEEFALRGGKRFRSLLLLAGYHIATGRSPAPVLGAAAALEHFQNWMLIHDDIMDHAEVRRGGRTVHRTASDRHRTTGGIGDSDAYGTGIGITLGDLEEPYTVESLLTTPTPAARRLEALAEFNRMTRLTAYGQLLDISNGARPLSEIIEEDVLLVHRLKSAMYTVAAPLRIGAILGGGQTGLLGDLEAFGVDAGTAFQLRDDVLGAGLESGPIGKSSNDLVEGKRTLLVVRAWAQADAEGRSILERVLGNPAATETDIGAAKEVIRSSGAQNYSETLIQTLVGRVLRRVGRSKNLKLPSQRLLAQIADRLTRRTI